MAHFQTLVIVHPSETNPAAKAEELMMPYFSSDYSSDAKCDGFVIGGRYDGDIRGKEQNYNLTPEEFQARYGLDVIENEDNIRPVSMIRPGYISFAVITPDGNWIDCEDAGSGEWEENYESLLEPYRDYIGVAFDCHC